MLGGWCSCFFGGLYFFDSIQLSTKCSCICFTLLIVFLCTLSIRFFISSMKNLVYIFVFSCLWRWKSPPLAPKKKGRFFIWQVIHVSFNTLDRLLWKMPSLDRPFCCILCWRVPEDLNHLFRNCDYAQEWRSRTLHWTCLVFRWPIMEFWVSPQSADSREGKFLLANWSLCFVLGFMGNLEENL